MSLLRSAFRRGSEQRAEPSTFGIDEYVNKINAAMFDYNGLAYNGTGGGIQQTLAGTPAERVGPDFVGHAQQAYASNGIIFACMLSRQLVFSGIRFRWQRLQGGRPSALFGSPDLKMLEQPWQGGTTQDLLSRVLQDADLAGNSYWTRIDDELVRLRPDWVEIALVGRQYRGGTVGWKRIGYGYTEGGPGSGNDPVVFRANEVAHFAPIPDPLATYRGMSWLTPVAREIQADHMMTRHRRKYFENGATPNMVIKHAEGATPEKAKAFKEMLEEKHAGLDNAYKILHLYPGADPTVVGGDLRQIDFKTVQGAGETRIAAAAGVPPVIVGLSEGLAAATYSNYGQARRRFADGTIHPLWANISGSFRPLLGNKPDDVRLWYDTTDVPFLREDEKDAAQIAATQASTITGLVREGYTPESAVAAIEARDWRLLVHSGLVSVQLQPPGTKPDGTSTTPAADDDETDDDEDTPTDDTPAPTDPEVSDA